jgi:hypothetical protein
MSVDIFVTRYAGDKRGDDIVDPLIGSVPVAIVRGRNELDERASGMQQVEVETIYRTGLRVGQSSRFSDMQTGEIWTGKIIGITHKVAGVEISSVLQVKRPTGFSLA